ncbi:hypothetical protein KUTeg_024833 [Tegillarca granosa]|uniref:EF-hand domain-containing protein n=1 Tax=Tegillarca granosa TaxID=220873 RepID=A0ABQ9E3Z5_TEGGR|nr:hypothetical protein KUTeg_024833 [Tegillarca granosa]
MNFTNIPTKQKPNSSIEFCKNVYKETCKQLNCVPLKKVLQQYGQSLFCLKDFRLSTKELKAIFVSLVLLVNMILHSCKLSGAPLKVLADFVSTTHSLRKLDLSPVNDMLKILDLSWNHIRGYGAIGIGRGLEKNHGIKTLKVAWNGFGFEGCVAVGHALCHNTTLMTLDLACNRIHPPALFELLQGISNNKTLSSLRLALNPITAPMTSIFLDRVYKNKQCGLKELDIEGVVVDKDFVPTLKKLQEDRIFMARYDLELPINKGEVKKIDPNNIFNIDPIRILFFMKEHLRTIDLFLKLDKDSSNSLTRDELQFAFEMEGYPISKAALDTVMNYLDTNRDGEVDLLK